MTETLLKSTEHYLQAFKEKGQGEGSDWLSKLREGGITEFEKLGFPSRKLENWKFTNVSELQKTPFQLSSQLEMSEKLISEIEPITEDGLTTIQLVFVNGQLAPRLSHQEDLPEGLILGSLRENLKTHETLIKNHLGQHAKADQDGFVALNTALFQDGTFLFVPKNESFSKWIHLFFITTDAQKPVLAQPRNLILLEESSKAVVIEEHLSLDGNEAFTNVVAEIILGANSSLDYYKIQRENDSSHHISATEVVHARDSRFRQTSLTIGTHLTRNNIHADLVAEGVDSELNGLYLADGKQHLDHHILMDHKKPNGTSRQTFKGIMSGASTGVFGGKVFIHKDAQKTDAQQTNKNILLSENAKAKTKPQLEIYADDVKAAHGAAVGQLDEDALFYLKSRGIGDTKAKNILAYGFASEMIDAIEIEPVREKFLLLLREKLEKQLR